MKCANGDDISVQARGEGLFDSYQLAAPISWPAVLNLVDA